MDHRKGAENLMVFKLRMLKKLFAEFCDPEFWTRKKDLAVDEPWKNGIQVIIKAVLPGNSPADRWEFKIIVDLLQGKVSDIKGIPLTFWDPYIVPGKNKVPAFRVILFPILHIQFQRVLFCPLFGVFTSMGSNDLFSSTEFFNGHGRMFPILSNVLENIESSLYLYSMYAHTWLLLYIVFW